MDELLLDNPVSPPRRYSVDAYDAPNFLGPRLSIFLNGVEQKDVVAYDCGAGTVLRNKLDAEGRAQIDPSKPGEVWRETVCGTVTVEWKDD
jgi:hypothetical protein